MMPLTLTWASLGFIGVGVSISDAKHINVIYGAPLGDRHIVPDNTAVSLDF